MILDRKVCNSNFVISAPSMKIVPSEGSTILNNAMIMDVLPAPVLPTIPTCEKKEIFNFLSKCCRVFSDVLSLHP